MTSHTIRCIKELPDLSMTCFVRRDGGMRHAKAAGALADSLSLLGRDVVGEVGLRYEFDPDHRTGPERLHLFFRVPSSGSTEAYTGSHLIDPFYISSPASATHLSPTETKGWHFSAIAKAEEAVLISDPEMHGDRFYFAAVPEAGDASSPSGADVDALFHGLGSPCTVQITVRPVDMTATPFRSDICAEIQHLDVWASASPVDRATSGALEELAPGRDITAARMKGHYSKHFDRLHSGRGFEFSIIVASKSKEENRLVANSFGQWFLSDGHYVVQPVSKGAIASSLRGSLRRFRHDPPVWDVHGEPCWSGGLAENSGEVRKTIGKRLGRLRRLSHLTRVVTLETASRMLTLPSFDRTLPRTIRLSSERVNETGGEDAISLGIDMHRGSQLPIRVPALTRHAFISGMTGSGKTTTVVSILAALWERGVPWLVIEPSKAEYRVMDRFGGKWQRDLRMYSPGNPRLLPLRVNPFQVPMGYTIDQHISALQECFMGAFGPIGPMPYLMAEGLQRLYEGVGLHLDDTGGDRGEWPTMHDFARTMDKVVRDAKYASDLDSTLRAAVRTRLHSLCERGVGRVFGAYRTVPSVEVLLSQPTIIEANSLGQEQANLLCLFLFSAMRQHINRRESNTPQAGGGLRHLTVLEEAHNLIGSDASHEPRSPEDADPRRHSAQGFVRMLQEVRSMGEGVLICDQSPACIRPEVLSQTNLKIAHGQQDRADRDVLAAVMMMDDLEHEDLARLRPGQAFVFHGDLHRPARITVPDRKKGVESPSEEALRKGLFGRKWARNHYLSCLKDDLAGLLCRCERDSLAAAANLEGANDRKAHVSGITDKLKKVEQTLCRRLTAARELGLPPSHILRLSKTFEGAMQGIRKAVNERLKTSSSGRSARNKQS